MFMVVVPLYIPVHNIQEFRLLYIHWYSVSLNFGHPSRYVVVVHVALISWYLMLLNIYSCAYCHFHPLFSSFLYFAFLFSIYPPPLIIVYWSWSSCYRPLTHGIYFRLPTLAMNVPTILKDWSYLSTKLN